MQKLKLNFTTTARVPSEELAAYYTKLKPEHSRVIEASTTPDYQQEISCMYTPFDTTTRQAVRELAQRKLELAPSLIILVGIGGSNLGALAVHQALHGFLYNETHADKKFYCVDTLDALYMRDLIQLAESMLRAGRTMLLVVVSKSGKTLETLTNASFFINLLKKHRPSDYHRYLIFLTNAHSPLWQAAQEQNVDHLAIPTKVGGRYSVFTPATLLPLALLDIDIETLCSGAHSTYVDDAALSAGLLFYHWSHGMAMHNVFFFSPHTLFLGSWYRQLLAESLGKKYTRSGDVIEAGIAPLITLAPADLHSVLQLYLAGPRNIFTTFVVSQDYQYEESVPATDLLPLEGSIVNKSLRDINHALAQGVRHAYQKDNRPFATLEASSFDLQTLGAFFYFNMAQTIFLGFLLDINPFDQPQIDGYKEEALHLLAASP